MPPTPFGQWLREQRKAAGYTQEQLAHLLSLAIDSIRKYERGDRQPSKDVARLIARTFQVPPEKVEQLVALARNRRSDTSFLPSQRDPKLPVFIGRQVELDVIASLLAQPNCRLITLVGPGGSGKSRLAREAQLRNQAAFSDGTHFVDLAPVESPEFMASSILREMRVPIAHSKPELLQLISALRSKNMLIILDNFEQLLEAAPHLSAILSGASGVKLLVTSRERLRLREEFMMNIDGLPYAAPEGSELDSDAARLFVQMAKRAKPRFNPHDEKNHIMRICRAVEGLPLGLIIAAAQTATESCAEIASGLENGTLIANATMQGDGRHASMDTVVGQTWNLLDAEHQRVLKQLAVFSGGFDFEAARSVAGARTTTLIQLVNKSLVRRIGSDRFDLQQMLRGYLNGLLEDSDEIDAVKDRHLHYFTDLCERGGQGLRTGEHVAWVQRLTADLGNLRSALTWSLSSATRAIHGLRLASAILMYWRFELAAEGVYWLEHLQRATAEADAPAVIAYGRLVGGILKLLAGRSTDGVVDLRLALTWFDQVGDVTGASLTRATMIHALPAVGLQDEVPHHLTQLIADIPLIASDADRMVSWLWCANYEIRASRAASAQRYLQEAHQDLHVVESPWFRAQYYQTHGSLHLLLGRFDVALESLATAMHNYQETRDRGLVALTAHVYGQALILNGRISEAITTFEEALEIWELMDNLAGEAHTYYDLAHAYGVSGDCARALSYLKASIECYENAHLKMGLTLVLRETVWLLLRHNAPEQAAYLLGAAMAHHVPGEVHSYATSHVLPREELRQFTEGLTPELRARYDAGSTLTRAQALAALRDLKCPTPQTTEALAPTR
jgi:predicted ATPase/transcriptional regulator with XRE-family HTH domain